MKVEYVLLIIMMTLLASCKNDRLQPYEQIINDIYGDGVEFEQYHNNIINVDVFYFRLNYKTSEYNIIQDFRTMAKKIDEISKSEKGYDPLMYHMLESSWIENSIRITNPELFVNNPYRSKPCTHIWWRLKNKFITLRLIIKGSDQASSKVNEDDHILLRIEFKN